MPPLFDPGGASAPGQSALDVLPSALPTASASTRLLVSGLDDGSLRPRCLRFAAWVTPRPRKTRFRAAASLTRAGLACGTPSRGFRFYIPSSSSRLGLAHGRSSSSSLLGMAASGGMPSGCSRARARARARARGRTRSRGPLPVPGVLCDGPGLPPRRCCCGSRACLWTVGLSRRTASGLMHCARCRPDPGTGYGQGRRPRARARARARARMRACRLRSRCQRCTPSGDRCSRASPRCEALSVSGGQQLDEVVAVPARPLA